jgi:hypothetical protein
MERGDKLVVGKEFFVILLYDKTGFYKSVVALSRDEVLAKTYKVSHALTKSLICCSLPFEGKWKENAWGLVPDLSLPPDFKQALVEIDRHGED